MQLEKWQRNVLYRAVEDGGLDPRECTFEYDDSSARIIHVPSASYFLLEGDITQYTATAVVGESQRWPFGLRVHWVEVEKTVWLWAKDVEQDVTTPDLWAELRRERAILTGARYEDVENVPFASDEQAEIGQQLRQIKEFVRKTYTLSEAQKLSLEAKLDDIEAAAGRIGRKDWLLLVCGVMFSAIVTGLLPPDAVQEILAMLLRGVDHLFGGGGTPPLLPPLA